MSRSISKNAIFKAILNLFNIILPIVVLPVVLSRIQPTLNGYITMGETFTGIFMIFASFGVYQYGLREVSRVRGDERKLSQTFTSLFMVTTITTVVTSIIYVIFIVTARRNEAYFYTCMIMGLNIVFNLFYVEWINEALENYDFIAFKTMLVKIIYSVLVLFFVRSQEDFLLYIYLGVGVNFINNILSFIYIKKKIRFDFSNLKFRKHIKPMFSAVILSNTSLLYTQLDKLMIDSNIGSTEAGYYAVAQKVMIIINTLMLTIIQVSMPRLSNYLENNSKEVYLNLLKRVIKVYFLLLFPASIGLLCVSNQVMWIFGHFRPDYLPAAPIMMVFSIYMLTIGVEGIIANQIIYLHGREKTDAKLVLIGGILNLILNTILLASKKFTPTTAIITTVISNLVVVALEYRLVKRGIKLKISLFTFENMKYLYYSLPFIPITYIINTYVSGMLMSCILDIIVCGVLYLGILFFTKDLVFFDLVNRVIRKIKTLA